LRTRVSKKAFMVAIILVSILSLVYIATTWESSEIKAEKKNVARYLKEKYGQDFKTTKVEDYHWYFGSKKQIRTYVVSNDNPPIEFIVARLAEKPGEYFETSLFFGQDAYKDYLRLRWNREAAARLQQEAEETFKRPTLLYASISLPASYRDQKFGSVPSYFDTVKNNPDIFYQKFATQYFELAFFHDVTDSNKNEEAAKIYAFMRRVKEIGIQNYQINIDYFAGDYAQEAQQVVNRIGVQAFVRVEGGSLKIKEYSVSGKRKYNIFLKEQDVNVIQGPQDVNKYFQKL
jgi:hypothetical protein